MADARDRTKGAAMSNPEPRKHDDDRLDPVSYMRSRRPDEYSDSEVTSSLELTQGFLE